MQKFATLIQNQNGIWKKYIDWNYGNRRLRIGLDTGIKLFCVMVMLFAFCGKSACGNESSGTYVQKQTHRISKTINREWTFNYFPAEDADTAGCQAVEWGKGENLLRNIICWPLRSPIATHITAVNQHDVTELFGIC